MRDDKRRKKFETVNSVSFRVVDTKVTSRFQFQFLILLDETNVFILERGRDWCVLSVFPGADGISSSFIAMIVTKMTMKMKMKMRFDTSAVVQFSRSQ